MRLPHALSAAGEAALGGIPVPVLGGPNAGRLWTLTSSGRGYVTGRFERDRIASILALARPGDHVWDVGAHKGYVSLALARRVVPGGSIVAFEPAADNLAAFERHLRWNHAAEIRLVPAALGGDVGRSSFGGSGSSITYRLGRGEQMVDVHTIAELIAQGWRAPTMIKLDVEGAEGDVLRGAGEHLRDIGLLFIAVHSMDAYQACVPQLRDAGMSVVESRKMRRFTEGGERWAGDADLVAFGPQRGIDPAHIQILPEFRP